MTEDSSQIPYRVLARKYRPSTFDELVGQEAMVRTLGNAIDRGRLAHAFILTGVRGIGKTTTARIIARALNCTGADDTLDQPTITPCGVCDACKSIAEDRNVDVLEIDAASHTGVSEMRDIIDGVMYAPVSARYKVYIIDEIHMLSRQAFNALLKTLEEPPPHVKFIFATTEIRKVPVTVLSRCQRFDLRRVEAETLTAHFASLAGQENAELEDEAIALIARAADGSVRDGLSLLDRAIAHGGDVVTGDEVRAMLGLADRTGIFDLFEQVMSGEIATALTTLRGLYDGGADPVVVLQDLLDLTHWLTRLKIVPAAGEDVTVPEAERRRGADISSKLSMPVLTRTWQMLLKGLQEARFAPSPITAAEMILVRLAYAADLPSPADLVRQIEEGGGATAVAATSPRQASAPSGATGAGATGAGAAQTEAIAPAQRQSVAAGGEGVVQAALSPQDEPDGDVDPAAAGSIDLPDFAAVVALVRDKKEVVLGMHLTDHVHLVHFEAGQIELRLTDKAPAKLPNELGALLGEWTGRQWFVSVSTDQGAATLRDQSEKIETGRRAEAAADPLVKAVMETFPGAKIKEVRDVMADAVQDPLEGPLDNDALDDEAREDRRSESDE
jgi:DNA polymerase-3 subunit gamma/tau